MLTTLSLISSWLLLPVSAPYSNPKLHKGRATSMGVLEPVPTGDCQNRKATSLCQALLP